MARRVYFAFHYQDVIDFRANVVRKHNALTDAQKAGYFDASIWEKVKKTGDIALKWMIDFELENTTATVVLIGSQTYERPWVRYEIVHSLARGNALLGVHINSVKGKDQLTKNAGPNPFDYLGLSINSDGTRASPTEYRNGKWSKYSVHDGWKLSRQDTEANRGKHFQLSKWYPTYDWIHNGGFNNFSTWID